MVGGERPNPKLMLNSTQVEVEVEVGVELGNIYITALYPPLKMIPTLDGLDTFPTTFVVNNQSSPPRQLSPHAISPSKLFVTN